MCAKSIIKSPSDKSGLPLRNETTVSRTVELADCPTCMPRVTSRWESVGPESSPDVDVVA